MDFFYHIGRYFALLKLSMQRAEKRSVFVHQIFVEIDKIGISSVGIAAIISFFFGAVMALQTSYNMSTPLLPDYLVGLGTVFGGVVSASAPPAGAADQHEEADHGLHGAVRHADLH